MVVAETEGLLDTVDGARDATCLAVQGTVLHNKELSHLELCTEPPALRKSFIHLLPSLVPKLLSGLPYICLRILGPISRKSSHRVG